MSGGICLAKVNRFGIGNTLSEFTSCAFVFSQSVAASTSDLTCCPSSDVNSFFSSIVNFVKIYPFLIALHDAINFPG